MLRALLLSSGPYALVAKGSLILRSNPELPRPPGRCLSVSRSFARPFLPSQASSFFQIIKNGCDDDEDDDESDEDDDDEGEEGGGVAPTGEKGGGAALAGEGGNKEKGERNVEIFQ